MAIPATELARRLCEAAHPHLRTTGRPTPCGQHISRANSLYGLLSDDVEWGVIADARALTAVTINEPGTQGEREDGAFDARVSV